MTHPSLWQTQVNTLSNDTAGYANTLCTKLDKISLKSNNQHVQVERSRRYHIGEDMAGGWWRRFSTRKLDDSGRCRAKALNFQVIEYLARGLNIKTNWAVQAIKCGENFVDIWSEKGERIRCSRVVVCVPLGVLKSGAQSKANSIETQQELSLSRLPFHLQNN